MFCWKKVGPSNLFNICLIKHIQNGTISLTVTTTQLSFFILVHLLIISISATSLERFSTLLISQLPVYLSDDAFF